MMCYDVELNDEKVKVKIIYITEKDFDNPKYKFYICNKLKGGNNNR